MAMQADWGRTNGWKMVEDGGFFTVGDVLTIDMPNMKVSLTRSGTTKDWGTIQKYNHDDTLEVLDQNNKTWKFTRKAIYVLTGPVPSGGTTWTATEGG
ncbi:MAG TPA: hypothetical protein VF173_01345 [Thermoanaerobaculia bacterium]|nr:hypothetical protein [Thermoanaerobaculia bacterium]